MAEKRVIGIIENQITQYEIISKQLEINGYQVFPSCDEYSTFIDWIRIFIDKRYVHARKERYFAMIKSALLAANIDLFILDYKLSGAHDGLNGAELALNIQGIMRYQKAPFFFLSRATANIKEVDDQLKLLGSAVWVEKGYAGAGMLEENYFKTHVIDKIAIMFDAPLQQRIKEILSWVMEQPVVHEFIDVLKVLDNKSFLTEEDIQFIEELEFIPKLTDSEIKSIFKKHKKLQ